MTQDKMVFISKLPEYNVWKNMVDRCYNPQNKDYKYYGARGISVCDRWVNSVHNFVSDMNLRPSAGHSIDRINNDGNYEPSNCRWATIKEQNANKRKSRIVGKLKNCKLKSIGVSLHKDGKYQASISYNGKLLHIGLFENELDAAEAYDISAIMIHGNLANLNSRVSS